MSILTKISYIVPVYNEAEGIVDFLSALQALLRDLPLDYEILVVDDGSKDATVDRVRSLGQQEGHIKFIAFSRNFGKEAALTAGLQYCRGDAAILIDADFQHPFELIPEFIEKWQQGYQMVYAVRSNRAGETLAKRGFTSVFYRLISWFGEVNIPPNAGDFRLLDRKVIDAMNQCGEHRRFMKGLYAWVGFKNCALPYVPNERRVGQSRFAFWKLTNLAMTGFFSFSDIPLRIWSLIGAIISGISFVYALYIVLRTVICGTDLPGFATLVVAIMFFGGIQLISIGILGEYIARIFAEVKKRPTYIVADAQGLEISK